MTARSAGRKLAGWLGRPAVLIVMLSLGYVFAQSYRGRELVVAAQRAGCERGIRKELLTIREENVFIAADTRAAGDRQNAPKERASRGRQVRELEAIREGRYSFVAPVNGGTLVCSVLYPASSPWPF